MHAVIDHPGVAEGAGTNDAEILAYELDRLLARHKPALTEEGVLQQVENLKRWLEMNSDNLYVADHLSETGNSWLCELCTKLKLAVEEKQRLEGEGGLPATREQAEKNEDLVSVIRRLEKMVHREPAHS